MVGGGGGWKVGGGWQINARKNRVGALSPETLKDLLSEKNILQTPM